MKQGECRRINKEKISKGLWNICGNVVKEFKIKTIKTFRKIITKKLSKQTHEIF